MDEEQNELSQRVAVTIPRRADLQQALRYVLIHDLGLTREAIRSDAMSFVEETVSDHFANLDTKRAINDIVAKEIVTMLRRRGSDYGSLESLVIRIAERLISQYIKKHLRFEVLDAEQVGALAEDTVVAGGLTFLKPPSEV